MQVTPVNSENYIILTEWWKGHEWPAIPFEMLPKIGYIVNNEVAGFIYSTDSSICMIEWIISDPKSNKDSRRKSLSFLLNFLCEKAKEMNYKMCFTYTKNLGLINNLESNKFLKTDSDMIHFVRSL
ncbi:hypothetical protein EBU94_06400 [bacterium]|nr:hypothetical protein [bacterium]